MPVVRTLQAFLPDTRLTWIVGKAEAELLAGLDGVELVVHDKASGYRGLKQRLGGAQFDLLMLMQLSLRAGLSSMAIRADTRLGFDRRRAKDLHRFFINQRIADTGPGHVIDGFFGFCEALGIYQRLARWDIPVPNNAAGRARDLIDDRAQTLLISPCSSRSVRNWHVGGYVAIARYAIRTYGMQVVITGGSDDVEVAYASAIESALAPEHARSVKNLVGQLDLKTLLVVMQRVDVVVAPDSGPVHLAMAAGTPTIGLYAETNPDRAAPVLARPWVVNAYPAALRALRGQDVDQARWGLRVGDQRAMSFITVDAVIQMLDHLMATAPPLRLGSSLSPSDRWAISGTPSS